MKKKCTYGATIKKLLVALPASALMLGAAHAGTTIGLNFQTWYYDSGANPQTVGYGAGYQTTGFPVTAKAFGVDTANWFNSDPLPAQSSIDASGTLFGSTGNLSGGSNTFAGSLTLTVTAPNSWQSGLGALNAGWVPETVPPGNDEVTWGYLDDGNSQGSFSTASVSGLAAKFPNGYVIQTIAAEAGAASFNGVDITDGTTTNSLGYIIYHVPNTNGYDGTVGLSMQSDVFNTDTINIDCQPKTSGNRSTLAGFIITDQPVISQDPTNVSVDQGATFILSAGVIGILPLSYQWQHDGTNVPGATMVPFSKTAEADDSGEWTLVATNQYGMVTSASSLVTVIQAPYITTDLSASTNLTFSSFHPVLSVVVSGAEPLSYQWQQDGADLPGETNSALTISNLTAGVSGFSVIITNAYGSATSATNYFNTVNSPDAYTAAVGQDSPVTYWPMSEASGETAFDYSGFGHDGALTSVTPGVAGPVPPAFPGFATGKSAYQFNASPSYVTPGTSASLAGTNAFTVEAWVNTTSTAGQAIVHQRSSDGYVGTYRVGINAGGSIYFNIYGSGGSQFNISSAAQVADGQWHQIVAVRDGNMGYVYVDGALSGSASGTVQALDDNLPVYVGYNQRDSSEPFDGTLANVAIYNTALSASQVINHYVVATGTTFALQIVPGGVIQDTKPVGSPHPGLNFKTTWLDSSTDYVDVVRSGVAQFSAANQGQITVPSDPDFDTTNGTICFWMKYLAPLPPLPAGNEAEMLFDRRTTNGTIIAYNDGGYIQFQTRGGGASFTCSSYYVADGNWHHVAVTFDQASNAPVSVYVDGNLDTSVLNPNTWFWPTNQEIELGRSHDSYWRVYDGQMDDFRIYNRILTPSEIATISAPATSDSLVDTSALVLRYNFDSGVFGQSIVWPYGTLQSSPVLAPGAVWTSMTNAISPMPIMPTAPAKFYRLMHE